MVEIGPDPQDDARLRLQILAVRRTSAQIYLDHALAEFAKVREDIVEELRADKDLFTYREMGQLVGMHPQTVGEYIRDGKAKRK